MHVRQLAGGCDQITGNGHLLFLRAQDPLVVMEFVAEMGISAFANRTEMAVSLSNLEAMPGFTSRT